ncbi:MAG: C-GCAxxG-C-C family protein [Bacteroidota bacterium]
MKPENLKAGPNDTRKIFRKLGPCSHTFFFILNREFGHRRAAEERASDPLAGGISRLGYQCGMLWGASLAIGAEAFRRSEELGKAIGAAIIATQGVMESFTNRTRSIECEDITGIDLENTLGIMKLMFTGKFLSCFRLAEDWTPEAIQSAKEGLSRAEGYAPEQALSCASEVARRKGASDEQIAMVAGFAGGLGLSGNACGALSAAIWMNALEWGKTQTDKASYPQSEAQKTIEAYYEASDYEILCENICGRRFSSVDDHTAYVRDGGCNKLIEVLAQS